MKSDPTEISLRRATDADFEFLRNLHRAAFRTYVEQTWGRWDEEDQHQRLRKESLPMCGDVVLLGNQPIGFLWVEDRLEFLFIDSISILPEHQNHGIGSRLLHELIEHSEQKRVPLRLNVLKVNPARRLYERLGFRVTGEDEFRHFMERKPQLG